ncbi:TIGR03862 family flavoprotein [Tenacibaculum sp. AHE15PA]|uniref:NAD(P)/FAD-dependent oxidoreductase n=1 Tax=unclassified Tenacibaculum TaxID=2635139 RepID=UPI001C4F94BD|nr:MULTISPECIES: NAD(P)-dependent oxidoreductase [unclassified Tenacibaculum]QXP74571.1 TIGR03862 family flavoprotein [Tenacibaculum sp. AHE14PA]QXP76082.1 TIGR03862 family flavoprotein [Tenacibaculum sp. AHE15PA]
MKKSIAIIGGGPSALFAAAFLDTNKFDVTIYEKKKSLGRKFLVAGDGGFNLSHGEAIHKMITRYTPTSFLKNALLNFTNDDLRNWLLSIAIPTFVGSSNRIYPEKGIKPITVLTNIKQFLSHKNIQFVYNYEWKGWNDKSELIFNENKINKVDYTIFSLGGASWKITGSEGNWTDSFKEKDINTLPFLPANCAYNINWKSDFISKNEGQPLKNIALSCLDKKQKGELVITKFGLEGNAIYALSPQIQSQLSANIKPVIYLDLKPMFTFTEVAKKINNSHLRTTDILKKILKLSAPQIALLKTVLTKEEYINKNSIAEKIKALPLVIESAAPLNEAISTTGGIPLSEVNENFELKKLKNNYCIGEMLDWNAPTGGYLLQACFSMGASIAKHLNEKE